MLHSQIPEDSRRDTTVLAIAALTLVTVFLVDIATRTVVHEIALGGQPDSIAISKDGKYVAVVIENERDEDLNEGKLPQLPAGDLAIVSLKDGVADCASIKHVALTGLAEVGADVLISSRTEAELDTVAARIKAAGRRAHVVVADLAQLGRHLVRVAGRVLEDGQQQEDPHTRKE